jgi:hypothetical protein
VVHARISRIIAVTWFVALYVVCFGAIFLASGWGGFLEAVVVSIGGTAFIILTLWSFATLAWPDRRDGRG